MTTSNETDPNTETDGGAGEEKYSRAQVTQLINAAVTNHTKRLKADFEKGIGDAVAKALQAQRGTLGSSAEEQPQGQPQTQPGSQGPAPAARPDPATVKLREELDQIKRKYEEAEARSRQTEQKARQESARSTIRQALEAKGIKGAKAATLVSHFEVTGALRFDEDGRPQLAVARSRAKGAQPEEVAFDLATGVEDWTKTDDAKDFLPPPAPLALRGTARPGTLPAVRPSGAAAAQPAASIEEAVDQAIADLATNPPRG